ncbi:MAG: HD domain-containing protein [Deltaproteobacteria bacterium]|nr:HD domain-containing protein [Deltaproteobacteria bacterium]
MIRDPVVLLDNLVLSLSDSLDLVHPCAVDHQQRVAYVALRLAQAIGYDPSEQAELMYAAVLHDIGVLSVEEKIETMTVEIEEQGSHMELGADLLRRFHLFAKAAEIVRFHHCSWSDEEGWKGAGADVRLSCNAIHLGDSVDRFLRRDAGVLGQVKSIRDEIARREGKRFAPDLAACFQELARQESFWLDLTSPRIYRVLLDMISWPRVALRLGELEQIGMIFSRIVDFRSPFTATHSVGVATAARELAGRMFFSEKECRLMLVAGFLHDLGKVAVPNAILDKPAKLDPDEFDVIRAHTYFTHQILSTIGGFEEVTQWAAFHHERLDGDGYPFHLKREELTLGSRIMCVADVFTAVTENRPYRRGTGREETVPILLNMVKHGALDENVVKVLMGDYAEIDRARAAAQEIYAGDYRKLLCPGPVGPGAG